MNNETIDVLTKMLECEDTLIKMLECEDADSCNCDCSRCGLFVRGVDRINALNMAIKVLKQVPKWIPVSERLPEEEGHYIVTDDSNGCGWVD